MAIWLCGLLAGLLLYSLRSQEKRSSKAWWAWGLLAAPALFFMLRGGSSGLVLGFLGMALWQITLATRRLSARGSATGAAGSKPPAARSARMSREEALSVLGLNEGASRMDIAREYKRLMKRLHPDVGGSRYLAAKLNEAREVLL